MFIYIYKIYFENPEVVIFKQKRKMRSVGLGTNQAGHKPGTTFQHFTCPKATLSKQWSPELAKSIV